MATLIRRACSQDAKILCNAEKYWAARPGHLVSLPEELNPESFARKIDELNGKPKGLYIVAESESGVIMGHALLDPMGLSRLSHIARLTIVVHPGFTRKGVGHLLMEELVSWAKNTENLEKIELLVRATNEQAVSLYKKFGFVEEGRLRNRIRLNQEEHIDDLTMGLLLQP
jgi:RimJ/RimL family protein N-acetyltransferase